MSLNLYEASQQWSQRPADERFPNLQALRTALLEIQANTREQMMPFADLRSEAREGEIVLLSKREVPVSPTWAAFGSLCTYVGAPAGYLRELPATLACQNLNHGMKQRGEENADNVNLLLYHNGSWKLRALTSEAYGRIPHLRVVETLIALQEREPGWRIPPARSVLEGQASRPATEADLLDGKHALSINLGDPIADAGLYYGQGAPELFAFMVNEDKTLFAGQRDMLSRGFFVSNDEGAQKRAFKLKTFYYRHVCGNHIVWAASGVKEVSIRHIGDKALGKGLRELQATVRSFSDSGALADEQRIKLTMSFELGADKDSVLDSLFTKQIAPRKALAAAYDSTEQLYPLDGSPRTAWGMAQGLSRISQECAYADERAVLDKAAGRVLELPF